MFSVTGLFHQSHMHFPYSMSLHWRHNEHDCVSNHQPHDCLLNRLFKRWSKKTSKLRVTGLCAGNSPGPVNSPHKRPVTRKMFPFDDVIMYKGTLTRKTFSKSLRHHMISCWCVTLFSCKLIQSHKQCGLVISLFLFQFLLYSNWPMLSIFHITRQPSNNFRQFFLYNHISHNHVSHSYPIQVFVLIRVIVTWWRHQMETLSVVLTLCAGNSPVTGEFPAQKPVKRGFDVFFDMRLNKRLGKQSWGWWFETPSCSLWRLCNELISAGHHYHSKLIIKHHVTK